MTHGRIITDPTIADGAPIIQGTQVPVRQILSRAATGMSPQEIADALPELSLSDVKAALEYAADAIQHVSTFGSLSPLSRAVEDVRTTLTSSLVDEATIHDGQAELDLNKILVVDDLEMNRLYMQTMFRDSEYELLLASDAATGLAQAKAELPFLIISDIQMPDMDGFELVKELKADQRTQGAAVIFVTAHHRSSKRVSQGLDLGADDYIFRPFERDELLSRVKAVARLKRAEQVARRQTRMAARRSKALELVNGLALAVTSSLDLHEIFGSAMQKLSELLDAEAVSLLVLEQETHNLTVNISSRRGRRVSTTVDFRPQKEVTAWVVQERVPTIVAEVLEDAGSGLDIQISSITCLPMTSKDRVVGAVAIINKQGKTFVPADWVLLNSAASIVAVAVENGRLLQSAQQQVADLALLNEIGHALTSTLDLDQILDRTTRLVQESLRAEAASLWLIDDDDRHLVLTASSGPGAQQVTGFRMSLDTGIAGYVAQTGETYFSANVPDDPKFFEQAAQVSDYMPGSMLCVPVLVKGLIIGVVQALHNKTRWFDQNDLRLLHSVASSVGIAIENARLFGQVRDFNRHLERMVAERTRELAEEKEKTEAILISMADGLLVLDADDRIQTANAAAEEMLECCVSETQGQTIGPEQLENPLWRCINDMVQSPELTVSASVDLADASQPGGMLSIQAHAARIRDEAGQIIGTVIVLRDITAIKEVERIKARFIAGVTHELKTPLSVIRLHANNLQRYHARLPDSKREDLLFAIQDQVKLLEQLVENILHLSRLDSGEAIEKRQAMDLAATVDQLVRDLAPLAETKRITLNWTKPASEVVIQADPEQIERVIRNLIENAIKYTPTGGQAEVQIAAQERDTVEIRVIDTGIGIPQEHQGRVFDRFYRVDPSHTIPGTGLGLSIVKEIVTAHGGDVRLHSKPGAGSTFIVSLPGINQRTDGSN